LQKISYVDYNVTEKNVWQKTKIVHDWSRYIPPTVNKRLYITTLLLIFEYIDMKDASLNVFNNEFYVSLIEQYSYENSIFGDLLTQLQDDKALKELTKQYFAACSREFHSNVMFSLLQNSVQVFKTKLLVNFEIQALYFELFDYIKVTDLNKESFLMSLRNL
jgi:hypothetical protein